MSAADFGPALRDLVEQVAAKPLGPNARIRVDLHPSREAEARAALADMPASCPPVEVHGTADFPLDSVHVQPYWWPPAYFGEPRILTPPTRPVPAEAPVVIVTPTIGSGTVARWYASPDAADYGAEIVSASRDGVIGGRGQYLTPDVFAAAWAAHLSLKAGRRVDQLATHRRPGVFRLGPVVPVEPRT